MTNFLTCIDGSSYADSTCAYAAWLASKMTASVDILHVLRRHSDYEASANLSGAIGLGARKVLLEELAKVDEMRGRLDQEKGKLVLSHADEFMAANNVKARQLIHRRGGLVDTIQDLEASYDMLFIGKRGEHADLDAGRLGSNLEKVARGVTKPLFLASQSFTPITRMLIAYDGKECTKKAVRFMAEHPSLSSIECHIIAIEQSSPILLDEPVSMLSSAGYTVVSQSFKNVSVNKTIANYVADNQIGLLAVGAYSHSPLHQFLLGSTTTTLILNCKVPMLLFR
jgi:nucleotide-binding universal stress UspA family protein